MKKPFLKRISVNKSIFQRNPTIFVLMAIEVEHEYTVVLKLPSKINDRVQRAYDIQDACLNDTGLPPGTWTIALATVLLRINAVRDAPNASARKDAMKVMNTTMRQVKNDVQTVVDGMTTGQETLITSAKLHVKIITAPVKEGLAVTDGTDLGKLDFVLFIKPLLGEGQKQGMVRGVRWEQSSNNNNWIEVPDSYYEEAKMTKSNFVSGTTSFFRARLILTKKRLSGWAYSGPIKVK